MSSGRGYIINGKFVFRHEFNLLLVSQRLHEDAKEAGDPLHPDKASLYIEFLEARLRDWDPPIDKLYEPYEAAVNTLVRATIDEYRKKYKLAEGTPGLKKVVGLEERNDYPHCPQCGGRVFGSFGNTITEDEQFCALDSPAVFCGSAMCSWRRKIKDIRPPKVDKLYRSITIREIDICKK